MSLSQNIKAYRQKRGLTQEQLATALGLSSQAISKWETSETYPDGALLSHLSKELDVSLDILFDNRRDSMAEISQNIISLISNTPEENRFSLLRDLCWQMQKGVLNGSAEIDTEYSPDEIENTVNSSYILLNSGFTHISNGNRPFFILFPEPKNDNKKISEKADHFADIFKVLGEPDNMKALLYLMAQNSDFIFDAGYFRSSLSLTDEKAEKILEDLQTLNVVKKVPTEVNGKNSPLYFNTPQHLLIALMLITDGLNYHGVYSLQMSRRSSPLLKNEGQSSD